MELKREEYLDYVTFGDFERPLFVELFGPLIGLPEEWRQQGAREEEIDLTVFGFDYVKRHTLQVETGLFGGLTPSIIEDTPEYTISRDQLGRTMKLIKSTATIPLPQDYPVTDMDSWLKIKPLYVFNENRFSSGWEEAAQQALKTGHLICTEIPGGFDEPRQLMGEENLCYAYYEEPELIHDILTTIGSTAFKVLERVTRIISVDHLSIHEDMAGKSGSLIGPNQISEFLKPYYLKIWNLLKERGTRNFRQDSDGNMNSVIDSFLDCGLTEMYPMEPAAGMDIVEVRKKYGKSLSVSGGVDKHVLRSTKENIRKELEYKLQPMMQTGGAVFGLDHRIPNGTPIENYRYYVKTAREILGLDPVPQPGWGRMAF
ncbi:MAG: hypothetical protein HQ557_06985 [Bacteroidetes bacterium]|nr:hypothetical protein [Bacteroidota bacterium]